MHCSYWVNTQHALCDAHTLYIGILNYIQVIILLSYCLRQEGNTNLLYLRFLNWSSTSEEAIQDACLKSYAILSDSVSAGAYLLFADL